MLSQAIQLRFKVAKAVAKAVCFRSQNSRSRSRLSSIPIAETMIIIYHCDGPIREAQRREYHVLCCA